MIICKVCGFSTNDNGDMIKHISQTHICESDNCVMAFLRIEEGGAL